MFLQQTGIQQQQQKAPKAFDYMSEILARLDGTNYNASQTPLQNLDRVMAEVAKKCVGNPTATYFLGMNKPFLSTLHKNIGSNPEKWDAEKLLTALKEVPKVEVLKLDYKADLLQVVTDLYKNGPGKNYATDSNTPLKIEDILNPSDVLYDAENRLANNADGNIHGAPVGQMTEFLTNLHQDIEKSPQDWNGTKLSTKIAEAPQSESIIYFVNYMEGLLFEIKYGYDNKLSLGENFTNAQTRTKGTLNPTNEQQQILDDLHDNIIKNPTTYWKENPGTTDYPEENQKKLVQYLENIVIRGYIVEQTDKTPPYLIPIRNAQTNRLNEPDDTVINVGNEFEQQDRPSQQSEQQVKIEHKHDALSISALSEALRMGYITPKRASEQLSKDNRFEIEVGKNNQKFTLTETDSKVAQAILSSGKDVDEMLATLNAYQHFVDLTPNNDTKQEATLLAKSLPDGIDKFIEKESPGVAAGIKKQAQEFGATIINAKEIHTDDDPVQKRNNHKDDKDDKSKDKKKAKKLIMD